MAETFESKALKDAQKALKQLEESAYDINTALIDITQSSDDLVNRIANLSGTSERLGAAWSVFSRLTVAIAPGIHKAEAALRSVAYIAKFQKVSREAEAKATKDILSTIKNIQKTRSKTLDVMEQIEKVQSGSATFLEREVVYRNDQLRYLIDMHGEEKAMNIAKRKGLAILDETLKMERQINKEKFERAFKEAKKAGNITAGAGTFISKITGGRRGQGLSTGLSNRERGMIGQYQSMLGDDSTAKRKSAAEKELENSKNRLEERKRLVSLLAKEEAKRNLEIKASQQTIHPSAMGYMMQGELEAATANIEERLGIAALEEGFEILKEAIGESVKKLDEEQALKNKALAAAKSRLERSGFDVEGEKVTKKGPIDRADDKESLAELVNSSSFLQGLFAPLMPVIEVGRAVKGVAKNIGPLFRTAKLFLGQALKFLAGVMITIAIVGLLYFLFKDNIKDFIDNKWPTIKERFKETYDKFAEFFGFFIDYVMAYWNLLVALFTGEKEDVIAAAREFGTASWNLVKSFITDLIPAIFKLGLDLVTTLVTLIKTAFGVDQASRASRDEKKNSDKMTEAMQKVADLTEERAKYEVGTREYNKLTRQINRAQRKADRREERMLYSQARQEMTFGQRLGARVRGGKQGKDRDSIVEDMRDGTLDTFSSGGVSGGGMALVGEGGPELVRLPTGARVFNNSQSRNMMGNVINIHVNGRMGATDQELNELARKLGEKINKEMNRFGASGFRA